MAMVQASSHTPQGAFGYLLGQIAPAPLPRLTVATHFPTADDTVACAMTSVQEHFPNAIVYQGNRAPRPTRQKPEKPVRITWSYDLMVITASSDSIVEQRGYVSDFVFSPAANLPTTGTQNPPLYWTTDSSGKVVGNPTAQIEQKTAINSCGDDCSCNYRDDGY
jgi:ribonuclease Z